MAVGHAVLHGVRSLQVASQNVTEEEAEEVFEIEFLTISVFLVTLLASQLLLYLSRRLGQALVPEAGLLLLLGLVIGGLVRASSSANVDGALRQLVAFDSGLFFIVLLPPIIFDSGFTIRPGLFFHNFGLIVALAVLGTLVSTIVVGSIMYALSGTGIFPADRMSCYIFGALISATDPVTVIAVFNSIGVKPSLQILVFGESVLNDAVALVLFQTLVLFQQADPADLNSSRPIFAVLQFCKVLVGSILIGVGIGFASALLFKHMRLAQAETRVIESSIAFLFPYISYTLADGLELSGIVSLLFTGIAMTSYTRYNLSDGALEFLGGTFHILAHMAETFVFIYLGVAVVVGDSDWSFAAVSFGLAGFLACLVGRLAGTLPFCVIANQFRAREDRVSLRELFVLWFSGLRGGMAFALAASYAYTAREGEEATGAVFESATTVIVFITVFAFGGTVERVCEALGLLEKGAPSPLPSPFAPDRNGRQRSRSDASPVDLKDIGFVPAVSSSGAPGISEVELSTLQDPQLHQHHQLGRGHQQAQQQQEQQLDQQQREPLTPPPATVTPHVRSAVEQGREKARGPWSSFERRVLVPLLVRQEGAGSSSVQDEADMSSLDDLDDSAAPRSPARAAAASDSLDKLSLDRI